MLILERAERVLASTIGRTADISTPWIMFMSWQEVLFASWPVAPELIRPHVPSQLELDLFDGQAWVSLVPLLMADVHFRDLPPLPGQGTFPELNLRTYVKAGDDHGAYFLSIECPNAFTTWLSDTFFSAPYLNAEVALLTQDNVRYFQSRRTHQGAPAAQFVASYSPVGDPFTPDPESLDSFLVERYAAFTVDARGGVHRMDIRHDVWRIQRAQAEFLVNTIPSAAGLSLPTLAPAHLGFAQTVDTLVFPVVHQQ
jgi:hypothetical protein